MSEITKEYLKYAIVGICSWLSPVWVSILCMLLFLSVDFITGIWASRIRGEHITSNKMRNTVRKSIVYFLLILLAHAMDIWFIVKVFDKPLIYNSICLLLASIEFTSVLENMSDITGISDLKDKVLNIFNRNRKDDKSGVD